MTVHITLASYRYALLCYAPTLTSSDDIMDEFYDLHDLILHGILLSEKIIFLGNFYAGLGPTMS